MKLSNRFDLNLLAVFHAIHERGSVTEAARQLNVTQSAISHALARLRRTFDDPLFVRSGNAMVPTALARTMVEPVQGALRGIELAVASAARFDPATTTRLFRLGLRQSAESRLFAPLVARAAGDAPGVRLASVTFRRRELTRALAAGELDVAVDVPSSATATLRSVPLQTDRLMVAARRDHPRIRGTLDLDAYLAEEHVVSSQRPSGPGAEDVALAAIGAQRRVTMRCQLNGSALQIVAASDRLLTVMRSHAESLGDEVQLLPFPIAVQPRPLQLFWHEAAERDPGNLWLRRKVQALFRGL